MRSTQLTAYDGAKIYPETLENEDPGHSADACLARFMEYMNEKAAKIGMSSTYFENPHGQTQKSYTTAGDLLKLGVVACGYPKALDIWSTLSITAKIGGTNERELTIANAFINATAEGLSNYYPVLGGKGGSLQYSNADTDYHRAQIILAEVEEKPVVLALTANGKTGYQNIYKSAKELCDMVAGAINGQTVAEGANLTALRTSLGGYCACVLPPMNTTAYANNYQTSKLLGRHFSKSNGEETVRYPASTTKTMTMICALDIMPNLHERITVRGSDISSGSGSTFYDGDVLTLDAALKVLMMESSNTLANAIARVAGGRLLSIENG